VFADEVGVARHLVALPGGVVIVALEDAARSSAGTSRMRGEQGRGGIAILTDADGDGRADARTRFETRGGSGLAVDDSLLYYSTPTHVLRFRLTPERTRIASGPDTVVSGIPDGGHSSRSLALGQGSDLYVNVGSDGNVCEGEDPCPELSVRAGIWRYDRTRIGQVHPDDGERVATGLRNGVALAWDSGTAALYSASHGRDGLAQRWSDIYDNEEGAEKPSEELVRATPGSDFGWPYCFHDRELDRKVLAPEYGGDGSIAGRCTGAAEPVVAFPGHWAPVGLHFYQGTMFPPEYRGGAFVAFHGSWNRSPLPQDGYKVVFVGLRGSQLDTTWTTFADDFAGGRKDPAGADHRPVGLAEGPEGALYISDDQGGRIWRVVAVP
jgi:glucose/arabinose dehydrogenase